MRDERFEWDDAKAVANWAKHGVSFADARAVFDDPDAFDRVDSRRDYAEVRKILIGRASMRTLTVIYTEPLGRSRVISARRANATERDEYDERAGKDGLGRA